MEPEIVKYDPFSSFVNPSFWHKLTQIKLDVDKLSETRKTIYGGYSYQKNVSCLFEVDATSFNKSQDFKRNSALSYGVLLNKNTIEDFKTCDKVDLLKDEGLLLWEDIKSGVCIENPSKLSRFLILSYADLKKYQYFYWFGFPAPSLPVLNESEKSFHLNKKFNETQLSDLLRTHANLDPTQKQYFFVQFKENSLVACPLSAVLTKKGQGDYSLDVEVDNEICFGFIDPSNNEYPGWALRNFVVLLTYHCRKLCGKNVSFIALRAKQNDNIDDSLIFNVTFPNDESDKCGIDWVGWERNERGKFGPRFANMASSMDPIMLAESSVDLNLKLMKWRLLPDLDLDLIQQTKCLLLGAGTLGCAVARNLLAWGVRHITFIDNGKVSFSNPVRQNLFNHEDCLNGGKAKATAAADNLKKIFPGVNSYGIAMHIPMPGHPVGDSLREQTVKDIVRLTEAICAHDVIFLLLDSREARWLPTLLAAHFGKLTINAALGFDSYLVMRHGVATQESKDCPMDEFSVGDELKKHSIPGNMLGCYFCNDITAPGNSQKDRTLDQQCTVTRPGVANIAGALAAEMTIAISQHKQKINAPAYFNTSDNIGNNDIVDNEGLLGAVPHSIRGFLSSYQHVLPSTKKFKQCIACSAIVMNLYKSNSIEFLMRVFESAKYLEDVTGLTELHIEAENAEIWALSDSDAE